MKALILPGLLALTSMAAYLVGTRVLALSRRELRSAVRETLELAGLTVAFLVANLAVGLAFILTARALSMRFVSVYILSDVSLVVLSALQGVIFGCWRRLTPGALAGRFQPPGD